MIFDSIFFGYKGNQILKGVSLKVEPGKITGLLGTNGCGKTTLLNIGAGISKPNSGNVFIDNKTFSAVQLMKRYSYIAYLTQETFLPQDLTVSYVSKTFFNSHEKIRDNKIIAKFYNQKISTLSGGELRYLELQLLFSLNRRYYLLDEPFTGSEPKIIDLIIEDILEMKNQGTSFLITDQYHRYVTSIVDNAYLLKNGQCRIFENAENYIGHLT